MFMENVHCSSSEVINSLFEDFGQTIDQELGLKKLHLHFFNDRNTLEEWPLSQLALKCHHLESLKLESFGTIDHNRS